MFETHYPELNFPGLFAIRRCNGCGLLFNSPRLSNEELSGLYDRNYYVFDADPVEALENIPRMYQRTVGLVESMISRRKVLEVGCGKGYFLAILSRLGWEVAGVEISPEAAAYAKVYLDLQVFAGTIEQYRSANERLDFPVVVAVDVIEHVPDPRQFVATARDLLEVGGVFVVDTPNGGARNIDVFGKGWGGFNPFHVFLFSPKQLTRLLEETGFSVEKVFSYANYPADEMKMGGWRTLARKYLRGVLLFLGLYQFLRHLRNSLRKDKGRKALEVELQRALDAILTNDDSALCQDAAGPLASEGAGDNFVMIARKKY